MTNTDTTRTTGRMCELTDLRMIEPGDRLSQVDERGASIEGTGTFRKDDLLFAESYECDNCGREFDDNFDQAVKHLKGGNNA